MARITVFGLDNMSVGEFDAICNRGWMVYGSPSASSGGQTSINVSADILRTGWLQPGRLVLVADESLPLWAGVIDTPIGLLPPASVSIYNLESLLSMRYPDAYRVPASGNIASIMAQYLNVANRQGELYLRMGVQGGPATAINHEIKDSPLWGQMNALAKQYGAEMILRPERDASDGNRLYTVLDVYEKTGFDTGYLLHDGKNPNMRVTAATLDRKIVNQVIGTNKSKNTTEKYFTPVYRNEASVAAFRARTEIVPVESENKYQLEFGARQYVAAYARPVVKLTVSLFDVGDTFRLLSPGNSFYVHASKVILQDGRQGFSGTARITALALNESARTVGATLEAPYDI